jgi:MFS family permease
MGLSLGGWMPTMSMLTSTNFGLSSYGTIFGMLHLFQNIGVAFGPFIAGYMYDTMDTYYMAFILFIALDVVAISTALAIRRPKSLPNF